MEKIALGVGDGTGKRFVHGDYESIKIVRDMFEENARLKAEGNKACHCCKDKGCHGDCKCSVILWADA